MAVTHKVILPALSQLSRQFRVVIQGEAPPSESENTMEAVMLNIGKYVPAARGDEVLIANVVAVDEMHRAVKSVKVVQHERGNQVTAVEEQFCVDLVGTLHSMIQIGYLIVAVG